MRLSPRTAVLLALGLLAGCASYAPRPLPKRINLPQSAAAVVVEPAQLPFRSLSSHLFDPADGLDMDEVAMLAVANNPQLRQARDELTVGQFNIPGFAIRIILLGNESRDVFGALIKIFDLGLIKTFIRHSRHAN